MLNPLAVIRALTRAHRAPAHLRLGVSGERAARNYLRLHGFLILERNFKSKYGEIDIIAREKDTIAFIEVKTRRSDELGYPEEAVNYYKQKKIIQCARHYIHKKHIDEMNIRFDIVSVMSKGRFRKEIKLIRDAFRTF
jgi:putative endonuclease